MSLQPDSFADITSLRTTPDCRESAWLKRGRGGRERFEIYSNHPLCIGYTCNQLPLYCHYGTRQETQKQFTECEKKYLIMKQLNFAAEYHHHSVDLERILWSAISAGMPIFTAMFTIWLCLIILFTFGSDLNQNLLITS